MTWSWVATALLGSNFITVLLVIELRHLIMRKNGEVVKLTAAIDSLTHKGGYPE